MTNGKELIYFAALAPSGHNTQPWKFAIDGETIRIRPDFSRRLPAVDPDDHALYISLGCALENLVIAARHFGFRAEVDYLAPGTEAGVLVRLRPSNASNEDGLFAAIPLRQTNRRRYDGRPLPPAHLAQLIDASRGDGVYAIAFSGSSEITRLIPFVEEASRAQFTDPAFLSELMAWIRFERREAGETRDGLSAAAMGLPWTPRWLGKLLMRTFAGPASEARRQAALLGSSSAALLFVAERNERAHWLELGRAFERTALLAATLAVQHAHVNMPCEVLHVRSEMQASLLAGSACPLLLVRLGYAPPIGRSLRRPVEAVVEP